MTGIIISIGVGIVIGMYIVTQISEHIDHRTRHKEFMKNLNNWDKKESKEWDKVKGKTK